MKIRIAQQMLDGATRVDDPADAGVGLGTPWIELVDEEFGTFRLPGYRTSGFKVRQHGGGITRVTVDLIGLVEFVNLDADGNEVS